MTFAGPLTATLARVAARERWLSVRAGPPADEAGWHCAAGLLADDGRLVDLVATSAAMLTEEHPDADPSVRRDVAAAVLRSDWSWALAVVGAGCLAVDARVPSLAAHSVWLQVEHGRISGIAATSPAFACAAADRAAASPHARPVDDLDEALRAELAAHLGRLHARLREGASPLLRQGPRAMWGASGDGVATALRLHAETLPDGEPVLAVAERVLAAAPRRWGTHGYERLVDDRGGSHTTRGRASCCLWYLLPDTPACMTCPRTSPAERAARLAAGTCASQA